MFLWPLRLPLEYAMFFKKPYWPSRTQWDCQICKVLLLIYSKHVSYINYSKSCSERQEELVRSQELTIPQSQKRSGNSSSVAHCQHLRLPCLPSQSHAVFPQLQLLSSIRWKPEKPRGSERLRKEKLMSRLSACQLTWGKRTMSIYDTHFTPNPPAVKSGGH